MWISTTSKQFSVHFILRITSEGNYHLHPPQQKARKVQDGIWEKTNYLACALQTSLVNTSKSSFSQKALLPEIPCRGRQLSEGESLCRDGIPISIFWHRSLPCYSIAFHPGIPSPCRCSTKVKSRFHSNTRIAIPIKWNDISRHIILKHNLLYF
jgi:hypothetical protein